MTSMRRAALTLAPALIALAFAAPIVRADGGSPVRIRDIRVGDHDGYERLVIELDGEAEVAWENGPEKGEESFYIAAAPAKPSRVIVTQLPHVGTISITEMKGGTHVAIEPRVRRVRAYLLNNPPRLVVDFAAPAPESFAAPLGARALQPARTIGPLVVESEPEPAPAPTPKPKPEPAPEPKPAPPAEPVKAEAPPASAPAPEPVPVVEASPELTPVAPVPAPSAKSSKPAKVPKTAKPAPPATTPAAPTAAFPYGIALAALAGLALLIAAAVVLMRRRAARDDDSFSVFPPEEADVLLAPRSDEISPDEILAAGDHDGLLEKRLDEEVRARLELEQRFAHANEELKVLRDRLHRLERRREGAG